MDHVRRSPRGSRIADHGSATAKEDRADRGVVLIVVRGVVVSCRIVGRSVLYADHRSA